MSKDRQNLVLSAIIEHFIKTAQPVGSKTILLSYNFKVSPATLRNDMANLERAGLITHPHTSAGRVPTDRGYRVYVDELADYSIAESLAKETLATLLKEEKADLAKQHVHSAIKLLSQATPNLAFATIPENNRTFFMGLSKMLRQPEFLEKPMQASQVMEVLEDGQHFLKALSKLDVGPDCKILIGDENILPGIDSCSLILTEYNTSGYKGIMGILGPKRMPYAFNTAVLTQVRNLL